MSIPALVLYVMFYALGLYGAHEWRIAVVTLFWFMAVFGFVIVLISAKSLAEKLEDLLLCTGILGGSVMLAFLPAGVEPVKIYHVVYIIAFVGFMALFKTVRYKREYGNMH